MRVLGSIVLPLPRLAEFLIAGLAHRRWVRFQSVGDDLLSLAMPLQRFLEETQSCGFIPFPGNMAFQNFTLVINSAPKIMRPPVAKACHPVHPLATDVGCKHQAKTDPPQPDRLV